MFERFKRAVYDHIWVSAFKQRTELSHFLSIMCTGSSHNILDLGLTKSGIFCKCCWPAKSRHAIDWTKLRGSGSFTQESGYISTEMVVFLTPLYSIWKCYVSQYKDVLPKWATKSSLMT